MRLEYSGLLYEKSPKINSEGDEKICRGLFLMLESDLEVPVKGPKWDLLETIMPLRH
ncbi:hypothetical protein H6P81_001490 [Aristolochia fimbriata]|uniref:Uncharacterized protein n=1 Tax=Aristolochia fimbriata TaxID=158543 RepID=A0AAV7F754_ARIFI|nr:hypothetical protein H6P81_001490 [Aristolochia fimbriata]